MTNNKIHFKIRLDHMIDLITNSSSELFVIANSMEKSVLVEMTNKVLEGTGFKISESCIEDRYLDNEDNVYDHNWQLEDMAEKLGQSKEEFMLTNFKNGPKWYGISFDRDQTYQSNYDITALLAGIGYEMVNGDY